jgi:glycosyltransferase involved in cell wall biosynthesis
MNILRLRSDQIQFDFILGGLGGAYEAEARSYGCRVHLAPPIRQISKHFRFIENVLRENRYDVYHVHGDEFLGDGVKAAARAGIPVRIVHSHNTKLARGKKGVEMRIRSWRHRSIERFRILKYATDILACSIDAGRFFVGHHWEEDPRCRTLYCGVPVEQFETALTKWSRVEFRRAHGIPEDAIVIGHVGSMGPTLQKNHQFILEVFAEMARRDTRFHLYMAGDGPHRPAIEQKVRHLGLQSRVTMPGLCDDVPSLMVHGFDVHLLPSLWEGLPVVGLEAVASGLFTVCSNSITKEFTDRFPDRITALSLNADVSVWVEKVRKGVIKRLTPKEGIVFLEKSPFSIHSSLSNLLDVYWHRLQASACESACF